MSLGKYTNFAILKKLRNIFLRKARMLKVRKNLENDWMYRVYQNMDQGSLTLGVMSFGIFFFFFFFFFFKLKCNLLNNFNVCGPTSMKLLPHLVSKIRKV